MVFTFLTFIYDKMVWYNFYLIYGLRKRDRYTRNLSAKTKSLSIVMINLSFIFFFIHQELKL